MTRILVLLALVTSLCGCLSPGERIYLYGDREVAYELLEGLEPSLRPGESQLASHANLQWNVAHTTELAGRARIIYESTPSGVVPSSVAFYARTLLQFDGADPQKASWVCSVWAFDLEGKFLGHQLLPVAERGPPEEQDRAPLLAVSGEDDLVITLPERSLTQRYAWEGSAFRQQP